MNDVVLMATIATVCVVITSLFWVWYQGEALYQIHREHVEDMQDLNYELISLRAQLANRAVRDRIMSSTPVGRLLDKEEDS